ncbi:MAG: hypothetical protein NC924_04420 [Candidatus Omnitrophica bacterium]|nr:hypothetical protein [Candidatus Omnitrophota bacterium]
MKKFLIDNGKSPDEPYNARLLFWLPSDSPYGNFQLKLMKLCQQLDEANRRLSESVIFWEQARTEGVLPCNVYERHIFANEQAVYLIRRAVDEMIALIWCLTKWEKERVYPNKIEVDCIGGVVENPHNNQLELFREHRGFLKTLNEIANAFKHSFVQSDITLVGKDEPCVYVLALKYNKIKSDAKLDGVSLARLVEEFNAFYKEGMDCLRAFSERNRITTT